MTITVNLTPTEEARLLAEAVQSGVAPEVLIRKLLLDHLPTDDPIDALDRKLRQWQRETQTQTMPYVSAHELFAQWGQEDAIRSVEQLAEDERLWQDFQKDIDSDRKVNGSRALF